MAVNRFAAIDIGTNTILLLIAELKGNRNFAVLEDRAEITRLGENVDRSHEISPAAEERSLRALRAYVARCKDLAVREIVAVGTSALRDARNAADFKERLRRELGLDLQVLSAEEEAAYSYLAVERGLGLGPGDVVVVDVGGGSTELVWGRDRRLHRWASLDLGAVRLTERYFTTDPPTDNACAQLGEAIDREIAALIKAWGFHSTNFFMVGVSGTFTTLAAVERGLTVYSHAEVHGARLSDVEVARQIRLYRGMPLAERRRIAGLEPGRADVIVAGAVLIGRIMALFGIGEAVVSDQGIRYGLLYERL